MPTYATLDDLPAPKCIDTWIAFQQALITKPEMQWLNGNSIRHDISAMRADEPPLLCVIKASDDWSRKALGRDARHFCTYDIILRLYMYFGAQTVEEATALYDLIESANEVMVRVLRSGSMACIAGKYSELFLMGDEKNGRTSVLHRKEERLSIITRIQLVRQFPPGT